MELFSDPDDEAIRRLLETARRIAVAGSLAEDPPRLPSLTVVMDRCVTVEHARLLGRGGTGS